MAARILTWYIHTLEGDNTRVGPVHIMDRDYTPHVVRVHCKRAPDAGDLRLDILDDGASIFSTLPLLGKGATLDEVVEDFTPGAATIERYSLVSLNLTPSGASGITVHLELEDAELGERDYSNT